MCGHHLLLGVNNLNVIRQGNLGALLAGDIVVQHDLHPDSKHSLAEENVSDGDIDVIVLGLTRVDHPAVDEFHALGSLTTELAADNNLTALGTRFHDETEDTVAGTSDGQTTDELVSKRLALGNGAQTTVGNFQSKKLF